MREYLSADRHANAIRLRRSTFSGTFLLVEGRTDQTFYERFIDKTTCELKSISGKPSSKLLIIDVLGILEKDNFDGILAIVDADFDHLETSPYTNPNLIRTDTHDLETMLINSRAFDKVIREFGSEDKITAFGRDIRTALLEAGISVGYLLWVSNRDGLNLTFEGIKFSNFIDEKTLKINEIKLIQEVKNKSQAFTLKNEDLQQRITNQKSSNHDPWQVCCGHHLVEILSVSLRKAIGSANARDVERESLERNLRLAYEESYFCKTQIYLSICTWENQNSPFRVLRT
ncbi:DUF4435 domain-containing protein [Planktothrix mougeotii]|uniref:DUF4435 domain-containing protein n=1 Tax=Planktothrix mougeotii LEGE 06226 TaxID=1828728 RepID=A0ABR9U9P5_9CYAN|nr:DUF4435 domain-containing protein [Planktothrix mougeotii]MBE9143169.1 DUF4435 domain-containing protein [Planktothrix mougeotii LEGE 06226]